MYSLLQVLKGFYISESVHPIPKFEEQTQLQLFVIRVLMNVRFR